MAGISQEMIEELEQIRLDHGGVLHPAHVVEAARSKRSALHDAFEWDRDKAARAYLLYTAQTLIRRVTVTIEDRRGKDIVIRPYVSLTTERMPGGGGYRHIEDVLDDEEMREQLIRDAVGELSTFQRKYEKYSDLVEGPHAPLAPVMTAIDGAREALNKSKLQAV